MNDDQAIELFHQALELPPTKRAAFLAQACGANTALHREVESLLAHARTNDSLFVTPAFSLMPSLTGEEIGRYRIEKLLGAGGMGEVYLAQDTTLLRPVALKVLPLAFTRDAARVQRFKQEAHTVSQLSHPNIITIHEVGEQTVRGATQHFLVTEYVVGQTLRERLKAAPLDAASAVDVTIQIADALRVAHKAAIIHRDIKPENVMLCNDSGLVKVLDFGIAKAGQGESATGRRGEDELALSPFHPVTPSLTLAGTIMGTASYMSPEQAAGLSVDERTDVYATGLVLYEMLTGQRVPRDDAGLPQLGKGTNGIPADLTAIIRKALQPQREARYASAAALLDALRRAQERLRNARLRRRWLAAAAAAGLLLVVALSSIWFAQNEEWKERILRDGHTAGVRRAIFSPDERLLVSVGEDNLVKVWDFKRRITLKTMTDHGDAVVDAAFSPKGDFFATASWDQSVIIWDAHTFEKVRTLGNLGGRVAALAFSPDNKYLATGLDTGATARTVLWKTKTWEKVRELPLPVSDWTSPIFSPTNPQMLYVTNKGMNIETNAPPINYPWGYILGFSPSFSHDGSLLLSNSSDGVIFRNTKSKNQPKRHLVHRDYGRGTAIAPDGKLAATCSEDLILWDVKTEQIITRWEFPSYFWSLSWAPKSGQYVVSTHGDGSILVWDIVARERIANFSQHSAAITAVKFTPDGRHVVSGSDDRTISIWNLANSQKEAVLQDHTSRINDLAIAPDGKWMVSTDQNMEWIQWDWETKAPRHRIPKMGYRGLTISLDGRWVGGYQGIANSNNWAMRNFIPHIGPVVQFSRDGQYLIGNNADAISLYRTADLSLVEKVKAEMIDAIDVLPDNSGFVTGEVQGQLKLWQMSPLKLLYEIGKHDARLKQLALAPDGQTVASVGDDKRLKLWQINPPRLLREIGEHSAPVLAVAFSPDGKQIVCGGQDRSVRVYTRQRSLWGWPLD